MQTRNVSFGSITAGAIRKGMILQHDIHDGEFAGKKVKILEAEMTSRGVKMIGKIGNEKPITEVMPKNTMLHIDLVGWVKKAVGKKSV